MFAVTKWKPGAVKSTKILYGSRVIKVVQYLYERTAKYFELGELLSGGNFFLPECYRFRAGTRRECREYQKDPGRAGNI